MKPSSRVFGVIAVAGWLAAAGVRAQDAEAGSAASGSEVSTKSKARKRSANSQQQSTPYGEVVNGPATPDAQGVPVANPNPLSEEKEQGELGGIGTTPGELVDDSNSSGGTTSSDQGK
jgi:hypothetical protein